MRRSKAQLELPIESASVEIRECNGDEFMQLCKTARAEGRRILYVEVWKVSGYRVAISTGCCRHSGDRCLPSASAITLS